MLRDKTAKLVTCPNQWPEYAEYFIDVFIKKSMAYHTAWLPLKDYRCLKCGGSPAASGKFAHSQPFAHGQVASSFLLPQKCLMIVTNVC